MEKKIWVPRPYYYFSQPYIKILLRQKDALRLFLLYEQLFCLSIPTNGRLRYSDKSYFTPALIAYSIEGGFQPKEVEDLMKQLIEFELVRIEEDHTIVIVNFDDGTPRSSTAQAVSIDSKISTIDEGSHHPFTVFLVKAEHLSKKDPLNNWDDFFNQNVDNYLEKGVTKQQMKDYLSTYVSKDYPEYTKKTGRVSSKLNFFKTAFLRKMDELVKTAMFEEQSGNYEKMADIASIPWVEDETN